MARVSDKTFFVGREPELRAIERHLADGARLVTILGHGGMGKTRLAVRAAAAFARDGRTWSFADLADAKRASDVVGAVAAALGVSVADASSDAAATSRIASAIAARPELLLVVDNAEGVVADVGAALDAWLEPETGARLLVTSRVRLERPDPIVDLGGLPEVDSLQLFEEHARRRAPDFLADDDTRELVRRLDGSPLAIELAAARAHVLPPAALIERFARHIDLVSGPKSARQASLRAVVAGSWALSTDAEQRALAAFSTFRGGFTLDAAEHVLSAVSPGDEASALIASLVDKSLLRVDPAHRYSMNESVRSFAVEQRSAEPAREGLAQRAHAAFFLDLARAGAPTDALLVDRENLLAAFHVEPRQALALEPVFAIDRTAASLRDLFVSALAREEGGDATRAELWIACAVVERRLGRPRVMLDDVARALPLAAAAARADLESRGLALRAWAIGDVDGPRAALDDAAGAVTAARRAGDAALLAKALQQLAWFAMESGDAPTAEVHAAEALALAEDLGAADVECLVHNLLGTLASSAGRFDAAERHFGRALAAAQRSNSAINEATVRANRARMLFAAGDLERASDAATRALEGARAGGFRRVEGIALLVLGSVALQSGDLDDARPRALHAERVLGEVGYRRHHATALRLLGDIALRDDRSDVAATAFERARAESDAIADAEGRALAIAGLAACGSRAADPGPTSGPRRELVTRAGVAPADGAFDAAALDLFFDAIDRHAVAAGRRVDLRKKPIAARILEVLLAEPGAPFEKSRLFEEVWRTKFRAARAPTLYKAIDRLAELLDPDPHRFFRWDEAARLVVTAANPGLLRLVDMSTSAG